MSLMTTILAPCLLFSALASLVFAQQRPDPSGTWKLDEARSGSPGWAEFVGPVVRVIRLGPQTLEIDVTQGAKTTTLQYTVSATKALPAQGAPPANRAYWEDDRLITETARLVSGQTVTMREDITIAPDGKELYVERIVEVEHGYAVRGAKNNSTVRDVFVRVMH
jgi:hypothetical protein